MREVIEFGPACRSAGTPEQPLRSFVPCQSFAHLRTRGRDRSGTQAKLPGNSVEGAVDQRGILTERLFPQGPLLYRLRPVHDLWNCLPRERRQLLADHEHQTAELVDEATCLFRHLMLRALHKQRRMEQKRLPLP